jgi:hypothetical protein
MLATLSAEIAQQRSLYLGETGTLSVRLPVLQTGRGWQIYRSG